MEYPVGVMTNLKKETVYYTGKGVDIKNYFIAQHLKTLNISFISFHIQMKMM